MIVNHIEIIYFNDEIYIPTEVLPVNKMTDTHLNIYRNLGMVTLRKGDIFVICQKVEEGSFQEISNLPALYVEPWIF